VSDFSDLRWTVRLREPNYGPTIVLITTIILLSGLTASSRQFWMSTEDVHDAYEAGNWTADELQTTADALFLRLNEIVELFQSLPYEDQSLGVFVLPASDIIADTVQSRDVEALLAMLRPQKPLAYTLEQECGITIHGQARRLNTRIIVNAALFKAIAKGKVDEMKALLEAHCTAETETVLQEDSTAAPAAPDAPASVATAVATAAVVCPAVPGSERGGCNCP
jgi:hypothetical protein